MTQRPELACYTTNADTSAPTRLLTDEGRPEPALKSDAERCARGAGGEAAQDDGQHRQV